MAEDPPQSHLTDEDRFELFERRLADQVGSRVEATLKYRYGTIFAILLSAAAFFGYDFIERARQELTASLDEISREVETAKAELGAFRQRVGELETDLNPVLADFAKLSSDFAVLDATFMDIEDQTEQVQSRLDGFIREQTDIIAINFGNTLDPFDDETAGFYSAILDFAERQDYTQLSVFATVQLAINRAFNNEVQHARRLFDQAEVKARAISNEDYINVLIQRASTESDQGLVDEALITLEDRAVRSLDGAPSAVKGNVYQAIGNIHLNDLQFANAIEKYQTAAAHFRDAEDFASLSRIQKTIGNIHFRRETSGVYDLGAAQIAYEEAIRVGQYEDDRLVLFQSLSAMAHLLKQRDQRPEARDYACQAAVFASGAPVFGDRNAVIREFLGGSPTTYEEFCL